MRLRQWLIATLFAGALGYPFACAEAQPLPSFTQVQREHQASNAWLVDRHGDLLQTSRVNLKQQVYPWVKLEEISPALAYLVILAEDRQFESHSGVNWSSLVSAGWSNVLAMLGTQRARGGSTLTMQLVGVIDPEVNHAGQRSVVDKAKQIARALELEKTWTKQQILEAYLNRVAFRGELVGVGALSQALFQKLPHALDKRESALAAVLLRAPNARPLLVAQRVCLLLASDEQTTGVQGATSQSAASSCEAIKAWVEMTLDFPKTESSRWVWPQGQSPQLAPHVANQLLRQPGVTVRSTLVHSVQRFAYQSLRQHIGLLSKRQVEDGAVVVIDNLTGEILAWVGSTGSLSQAASVDGATALRQAGSTLKPFLYGLAFEKRLLTPASLLLDEPFAIDTGLGLYNPKNYDTVYQGLVSVRTALGGSLNIPAVKALVQVGVRPFHEQLQAFGINSLNPSADWYGYSLALGSADVTLLALTNAYRALANQGLWSPTQITPALTPKGQAGKATKATPAHVRAMSPEAAFLVGNILSDRSARVGTFGLESWLSTPYWSAVKTGTSKDMRDNWCVGFSNRYTVGVWVGNASGEPMHDVSGVSGAAPVWREVLDYLHRNDHRPGLPIVKSLPPKPPEKIVAQEVSFTDKLEPSRKEWFIQGTETCRVELASMAGEPVIEYPVEGTVIALDPDVPPSRQRIKFKARAFKPKTHVWLLNGRSLSSSDIAHGWLPMPGRHLIQVRHTSGKVQSSVAFEVKALRGGLR